jgi:hypothetical protein
MADRLKRNRYVIAARGTGWGGPWQLFYPRRLWAELSDEEKAAVVAQQERLMKRSMTT